MTHWRRHFLGLEAAVVIGLTGLLACWMFFFDGVAYVQELMQGGRSTIYGTTASIGGTLLGFSITGLSLLLSFSSSPRLSLTRNSKHYPTLWKTLAQATRCLGALTISALVCLAWDKESAQLPWLVIPFCLFVGLSVVRLLRVVWIVEQIVGIISKSPQPMSSDN